MQVVITAVGPDNVGLADPIVHYVTGAGANIHEIQMYDRDSERLFAMIVRAEWPAEIESVATLRQRMRQIGQHKGLSIRVWSPDEHARPARLAILTTFRPEPALGVLRGATGWPAARHRGSDDRQPRFLPRAGRTVRRALAWCRRRQGKPGQRPDCRTARRIRGRLRHPRPLHANRSAGHLLAVCRRADYQPAPRAVAALSGLPALRRRLPAPHADLRSNGPLHRAGTRCRQPDHPPRHLHRPPPARRWRRSNARAKPTTNRTPSSKASGGCSTGRSNCDSTASCGAAGDGSGNLRWVLPANHANARGCDRI